MKFTIFNLQVMLAVCMLMLVSSCSDNDPVKPEPQNPEEDFITFSFTGMKRPVTYAVSGSNAENVVDSLDIYMFHDGSKRLEKVFRIGSTELGQSGVNLTAKINVTGRTGKRIFYFVANAGNNASELAGVSEGSTLEADFLQHLTDQEENFIKTPLLMTARLVIDDLEAVKDVSVEVRLTRRVARFDAQNDSDETNFILEKILVDNVKQKGYIFGEATADPDETLPTGHLPVINYSDSTDANIGTRITSLFYLHPTAISTTETMIYFEGIFNGERRIYDIKSTVQVEANKCYLLKVKKTELDELEFDIIVNEWDEGATYEGEQKTSEVVFSAIEMEGGAGVTKTDNNYDITNISEAATLTFTVESNYFSATKAVVTGNVEDLPGFAINEPTPVLSYGVSYEQKYEITIPERTDGTAIDISINIVNQSNFDQYLPIIIHADAD